MSRCTIAVVAVIAAAAAHVHATEGINLIGIGPVQQGTAGAGVASAKDSTWLLLNPAGLVDLQPRMDTFVAGVCPGSHHRFHHECRGGRA